MSPHCLCPLYVQTLRLPHHQNMASFPARVCWPNYSTVLSNVSDFPPFWLHVGVVLPGLLITGWLKWQGEVLCATCGSEHLPVRGRLSRVLSFHLTWQHFRWWPHLPGSLGDYSDPYSCIPFPAWDEHITCVKHIPLSSKPLWGGSYYRGIL